MTIGQVYTFLLTELKAKFAYEEAKVMVVSLLEHHLQLTKARIMLQFSTEVPDNSLPPLAKAMDDLLNHKPLQYVLGKAWFHDAEYIVNQHVLIPRPETEMMVDSIINELKAITPDINFPLRILDIGTGSGCIAVTLKNHFPDYMVYAMDFSEEALQVARQNAINNRADVVFYNADILVEETLEGLPSFDIIVSNPPYVLEKEKALMAPNVLNYEPKDALFVPDNDPLLYYRAIAHFASSSLRPRGYIYLEVNENYAEEVKSLYLEHQFTHVQVLKDLSGKDRYVQCQSN